MEECENQEIGYNNEKFSSFQGEVEKILESSKKAEGAAKEFDRIFLELLRFIKDSTDLDKAEKTKLEQDTKNLIKKLLNRGKFKKLSDKMDNVQKTFFEDICNFLNSFVEDSNLSAVHNNIPHTSLSKFSEKSIGDQIFQILYARNRGNDGICEGGSCSYWAILLYNFFNKLKEAGLDMKISFYRYKELDDENVFFPTDRHSGLIINFQGKDYIVECDGLTYRVERDGKLCEEEKRVVMKLQPYIDVAPKMGIPIYAHFFENFKYENRNETDSVIFFDDLDSFIQYCEKYPERISVSFYAKSPDGSKTEKVIFLFCELSFTLGTIEYYLKDNKLQMNNLVKSLINKAFVKRIGAKYGNVTAEDREMLKKYFSLIKNKVDLNKLHKNFTDWPSRKAEFSTDLKNIVITSIVGTKTCSVKITLQDDGSQVFSDC